MVSDTQETLSQPARTDVLDPVAVINRVPLSMAPHTTTKGYKKQRITPWTPQYWRRGREHLPPIFLTSNQQETSTTYPPATESMEARVKNLREKMELLFGSTPPRPSTHQGEGSPVKTKEVELPSPMELLPAELEFPIQEDRPALDPTVPFFISILLERIFPPVLPTVETEEPTAVPHLPDAAVKLIAASKLPPPNPTRIQKAHLRRNRRRILIHTGPGTFIRMKRDVAAEMGITPLNDSTTTEVSFPLPPEQPCNNFEMETSKDPGTWLKWYEKLCNEKSENEINDSDTDLSGKEGEVAGVETSVPEDDTSGSDKEETENTLPSSVNHDEYYYESCNLEGIKAIQWGRTHEDTARNCTGKKIASTGICGDTSSSFGSANRAGVVSDLSIGIGSALLIYSVVRYIRDSENPLEFFEANEFRRRYRFTKEATVHILFPLVDAGLSKPNNRRLPFSPMLQLISLRYYATCSFQTVCGDLRGASQPSVQRCSILLAEKCREYVKFPEDSIGQRSNIIKFYNYANFPTNPATWKVLKRFSGDELTKTRQEIAQERKLHLQAFGSANRAGVVSDLSIGIGYTQLAQ
ncbi:hypothetical protein RN001_003756 [Aquatica leii]|uniref:Uncharacterized protein n=1 Tax=Aquatica leii TaxID=1421715 RepID=A0AAN7PFJ5_9COLE|nr:hypothetical protein RN001_003756 [Aquatica leii]